MAFEKLMNTVLLAAAVSLVAACASSPADAPAPSAAPAPVAAAAPAAAAAPTAAAQAQPEADAATLAEKKFQEAARSYRKVEKDGKTMYCKKEKPMGSTIPRLQCIAESQLRLEVERTDELRDRMRNSSRCTHGSGCSGGG